MAQVVTNGYPIFTDANGDPLEDGYIFIGVEGLSPLTNPQAVYWDVDLTIPATDIRTSGGYAMYSGSPGRLYTANAYSLLVQDSDLNTIYYQPTSIALEIGGAAGGLPDVVGGLPIGTVLPKNGVTFDGFLDLGTTGLADASYPELVALGLNIISDNGNGTFDILPSGDSTGFTSNSSWSNQAITITHSMQLNASEMDITVWLSSLGTEATAIKVIDTSYDAASGANSVTGLSVVGVGNASFIIRTGTDGVALTNTDGTRLVLTNQSWYYKVDYKRRDTPHPAQVSTIDSSFAIDGGDAATVF
jgi:hypothetical protein